MKQSYFLRQIGIRGASEKLCFHTLYGIGEIDFIYDQRYIDTLRSFTKKRDVTSHDDPGIVQDLVDAGYLIEDHVTRDQERARYDAMINDWVGQITDARQIDYLDLMVSERCNFACGHCSRKYTVGSTASQLGLMAWDTAKASIDWYMSNCAKNGVDKIDIHFGSDEPLLNFDVVKRSVAYIRDRSKDAVISINTNLSLVTSEIARFFRDHNVDVIASLDGLAQGNDLVRVLPDGRGTFDHIYRGANVFAWIDYPLSGFITTILDKNWNSVTSEYVRWLAQEGFKSIAVDVDLVSSMQRTPTECAEKLIQIYNSAIDEGMVCGGAWTNPFKLLISGSSDGVPAYCKAIKGKGVAITSDGHIQTCSGCGFHLGHINEIDGVFDHDSLFQELVRSKMVTAGTRCDGCVLEAVCKNQCFMTSQGLDSGDVVRKKEMCRILRSTTVRLLQLHLRDEIATMGEAR